MDFADIVMKSEIANRASVRKTMLKTEVNPSMAPPMALPITIPKLNVLDCNEVATSLPVATVLLLPFGRL